LIVDSSHELIVASSSVASFEQLIVAFRICEDSKSVAACRIREDSVSIAAFRIREVSFCVACASQLTVDCFQLIVEWFPVVAVPPIATREEDAVVVPPVESTAPYSSVASSQLIVASQTSVASLVVASHLYFDNSSVGSFKLIVASHLVDDKVPLFPSSNCTALCEGDIARLFCGSLSKLIAVSVNLVSKGDDVSAFRHFNPQVILLVDNFHFAREISCMMPGSAG